MKKGDVSNLLRTTGLLPLADNLRYQWEKFKNRKINQEFKRKNPLVALPPDYLIYESFKLDYRKYFSESEETAQWLAELLKPHIPLRQIKILDWGCGPGRVIRHIGKYVGEDCKLFGTDYNPKSIEWCSKNLKGITFNNNNLEARLPWAENYFDVIYGISIFTHLSKALHFDWYKELIRVLKPGGIFLFTTQGNNFKVKLVGQELEQFEKGDIVVRGNVTEGHRTYSAFHPPQFIKQLTGNDKVLEHHQRQPSDSGWLPQDVWIIQKVSEQ